MADALSRLSAALSDRYRLERELGQGGMATVYLAEDLKHDRKVAIKVLKPELAAVLGAERFVSEIKTTAALQHPNILPLFDSGEADGFLFYVMPYVEGETLRAKLDRDAQLGIDASVKLVSEVADALDYAHRHGVVHRDIKPENILLHDGRPMVADFGIALAVSAAAGGRMTETGLSLGTPHYMSPEQATAEKTITGRSDIYSLASVLYEMLTGDPPHTGKTAQQVIAKIIAEDAPLVTNGRKAVPANVAAALSKSLQKLPADRFDSARAFADALADPHFSTAGGTTIGAAASPARQRGLVVGLSLFGAAMTAVAAWALLRPRPEPPVSRYALSLPADQTPAWDGFVVGTSDGSRLVYQGPALAGQRGQLWVKQRDRVDAVPLAGTGGATAAAISPDDQWLVFVRGSDLLKRPLAGGPATALAHDAANVGGAVTWLDDGSIVYAAADSGRAHVLERIGSDGGTPARLWSSPTLIARMLTPLPHARGVLFEGCEGLCMRVGLFALNLATDSVHEVRAGAHAGYVVGGNRLVFIDADQTALAVPFDMGTLRISGTAKPVADTVSMGLGLSPYFWVTRDGGTLAMQRGQLADRNGLYQFVWADSLGRIATVDTSTRFAVAQRGADFGWRLSPNGRQVVVGVHSASGDRIWVKALPQGAMWKVTDRESWRPRWSPDGAHVTFVGDSGMYMARADGTGRDSLLWPGQFDEGIVSPDGRWLLVRNGATGPNAGGRVILGARLGVDTALRPIVTTSSDAMAIELSPDGRWLAYESNETGRVEIYVRPFPITPAGGRRQVSARGGTGPLWSPNGRTLHYLRSDGEMMAVPWPPAHGVPEAHELFHLNSALTNTWINANYYTPWDVDARGRFLMVQEVGSRGSQSTPLIVVENWDRVLRSVIGK